MFTYLFDDKKSNYLILNALTILYCGFEFTFA